MLRRFHQWLLMVKARIPARPLFLKFFLCFLLMAWGTTFAVQLGTFLMGPRVVAPPNMYATVASILAAEAVRVYESGGPEAFAQFSRSQEVSQERQLYLLDGFNREVLSRPISRDGINAALHAQAGQLVVLRDRIAVFKYISPSGRPYILMLYMKPGFGDLREVFLGSREEPLMAGIVFAVTLFCAWLAYQISTPVRRLQLAARKVAEGDLTTRVPNSVLKRRDELAALGRDFDSMVGRLELLVRNQKNLLDSVSHELRSPLARINLTVTLLRKRSLEKGDDLMDRLERDVERIDVLMGQLLTLSRLENGISSGRKEKLDLVQLVEEVVADGSFEAQAGHKTVRLTSEWSPMLEDANSPALRSAFENIIRNSIRFTQPGTEVRVSLERVESPESRLACITVSDSGPGIPDEFLTEIFQPFFRVPGSELTGTGNGLGLAIAHEAIRLHGGTISAQNLRPAGVKVIVHLPVAPRRSDPSAAKHGPLL